jgi:hypothetical protein
LHEKPRPVGLEDENGSIDVWSSASFALNLLSLIRLTTDEVSRDKGGVEALFSVGVL